MKAVEESLMMQPLEFPVSPTSVVGVIVVAGVLIWGLVWIVRLPGVLDLVLRRMKPQRW